MKIAELKQQISDYNLEEVKAVLTETYKAVPKAKKEELDDYIIHLRDGGQREKKLKKPEVQELESLKKEIESFLSDAYDNYYIAPNRVVSKKDRPKWRFKVKNYFNLLVNNYNEAPDVYTASQTLNKLYDMMRHGCCYYLFNTRDTFTSAQIPQVEFFSAMVDKNQKCGWTDENIETVVEQTTKYGYDWKTTETTLMKALLERVPKETYPQFLSKAMQMREEMGAHEEYSWMDTTVFLENEQRNNLSTLVLFLRFEMGEYEEGISYFLENYDGRDKEVRYYVLFGYLKKYNQKELWIQEYERGLKKKIDFRNNLAETYNNLKKYGSFEAPQENDE